MSEYQYYEFAAVDRPLTLQQQAELRHWSSRATISSSRFINEYHWGNFKGNPEDWMRRYFDAHVYLTNWGHCRLMLRLPRAALEASELAPFIVPATEDSDFEPVFSAEKTAEHWILDWNFNDDSGEFERFWNQDDGADWMERLLALRDELLRGDPRPLYLGWLARAHRGEFGDSDLEPPLPAGLDTLTPAQQAQAEFLLIDPDWLSAAAADSPALSAGDSEDADVELWLQEQTEAGMRATMRLLVTGDGPKAERSVRSAYLTWQRQQQRETAHPPPERRRLGRILEGVKAAQSQRRENERLAQEAERLRLQSEYDALLTRLVQEAPQVWQEIDSTVGRGTGSAYEQAFKLLLTLAQALKRAGLEGNFQRELASLLERHRHRPAWMKRISNAKWP